jgi:hypothetical protein
MEFPLHMKKLLSNLFLNPGFSEKIRRQPRKKGLATQAHKTSGIA